MTEIAAKAAATRRSTPVDISLPCFANLASLRTMNARAATRLDLDQKPRQKRPSCDDTRMRTPDQV
jgi:hypothetical protein